MEKEDEIILRRLVTKQQNLTKMIKKFQSLETELLKDTSTRSDCEREYNEFERELEIFLFNLGKSYLIADAAERQLLEYVSVVDEMEKSIALTTEEIASLKNELREEKLRQQRREQYEVLAREIQKIPSKTETEKSIAAINEEKAKLLKEREEIEEKIEMRKKQLHLLVYAVKELQVDLKTEQANKREREEIDRMDTS